MKKFSSYLRTVVLVVAGVLALQTIVLAQERLLPPQEQLPAAEDPVDVPPLCHVEYEIYEVYDVKTRTYTMYIRTIVVCE